MTRLVYFTPHTRRCRLAAQVVATSASYLPPGVLTRLVGPLLRCSRSVGGGRLQRAAGRVIYLIVGDGAVQRARRQQRRRGGRR